MLPPMLHNSCLYEGEPDLLASRMQDAWHLERPSGYQYELQTILHQYDPVVACRAFDEHLGMLAARRAGK